MIVGAMMPVSPARGMPEGTVARSPGDPPFAHRLGGILVSLPWASHPTWKPAAGVESDSIGPCRTESWLPQ